jgi:hypothetical protein
MGAEKVTKKDFYIDQGVYWSGKSGKSQGITILWKSQGIS